MEYEKNIYTVWQTLEKNLLYANQTAEKGDNLLNRYCIICFY